MGAQEEEGGVKRGRDTGSHLGDVRAQRAVDARAADAHERAEGEYGPVGGGGVVAAVGAAEVGLLELGLGSAAWG